VFRIPEVRTNMGRWGRLADSGHVTIRTNGCNLFVCLPLSYRGLCTLHVFLRPKNPVETRGNHAPNASAGRHCSHSFLVASRCMLLDNNCYQ
jgi:hypothetical protein